MEQWDGVERRSAGVQVTELAARLQTLHSDVADIKGALRELTVAINKLAVIEERQSTISATIERAFTAIDKIENRLTALEKEMPNNRRIVSWVDRGLFAIAGVALMAAYDYIKGK